MNYQSCTPNSQLSSSKGQYHLLLLRGIGYLLPLSLLGSGIAFPQSSPNSQPQSLQNVNQGASSSSLESLQASQEKQESALPDYESVPAMQINDSENQNKQGSSSPQSSSQEQQQASSQSQALSQSKQQQASSPSQSSSQEQQQAFSQSQALSQSKQQQASSPSQSSSQEQQQASSQSQSPSQSSQGQSNLKPIQPLDNSSSPSPQTSSQNNSAQRKSDSPQKTTNSANDSSTPTVELEQRESEQSSNSTTAQSKQSPLPKLDNSKPQEKSTRNSASQDFIDSNTYPQQEERSLPAPKVEVSDRESNCKTVIENGKLVSGSCNNVSQGATNSGQSSSEQAGSEQARVKPEKLPELPKNFEQPNPSNNQPNPSNNQPNPSNNQPNPSNNQERVKSTYTPPEDLPKLKLPGNGDSQLLFPLVAASAISADYGWRLHPVVGERRFHTGTDFAAPEGTPVVAAKSGRVSLADYRSGYGLMVGLRHNDKNESRYAHLSQIHVRPGQWVEQGTVIGRVGNTGLSTGPHLHFEWRIRKGSRWVVVNAKEQLLAARDNLDSSQLAYSAAGKGNKELQGGNFFANLPKVFASLPKQPASWMSLPQLDFLKNGDFDRAYERQAPLSNFSQRAKSVLVLPLSLPDVLASVLNWQPPQLFAEETLQRVPTQSQTGFGEEFVYRAPSPSNQTVTENYPEIARQSPKTIESATNMEALGTLNFSAPRPGNPQKLSDSSLKDSHVLPRRIQ